MSWVVGHNPMILRVNSDFRKEENEPVIDWLEDNTEKKAGHLP